MYANSPYFVSPHEYLFDDEERWTRIENSLDAGRLDTEESLSDARQSCRQLALTNEFAICGHENRVSFVVGAGHQFHLEPVPGANISDRVLAQAQTWIDNFILENDWFRRQQEIQLRKDRDGEVFIRFFVNEEGETFIRFVEPEDVFTPEGITRDAHTRDALGISQTVSHGVSLNSHSTSYTNSQANSYANSHVNSHANSVCFGIQTRQNDAESVLGYWINGMYVPASQVQHRKANVDRVVPRGIPLFYPVRKNLRRAEKLLRNMSVVAEIQSAIAIIRKHNAGSRLGIENFVTSNVDANVSAPDGRSRFFRQYTPGTILDTSAGIDYQFPVAAVDASRYILVLQAELRAIASRLVMPEFMLTSDASNANYSSTMIAEGPAVRMFERLQHEMISEDLRLMKRVLFNAVTAQKLPPEVLTALRVQSIPPKLSVRDRLAEIQADRILVELGAMSKDELRVRYSTVQINK